jgi:hypothetical protein
MAFSDKSPGVLQRPSSPPKARDELRPGPTGPTGTKITLVGNHAGTAQHTDEWLAIARAQKPSPATAKA